ncbi:MAG: CCA tRNA nucleotidyltransferase [Tropicimonas sp.]|uniref:CCA tRNA nucleotidyltransferase n=1 Tax=Tropicimonas sp. TaxID=2067044 RepID=UPI003A83A000
MSVLAAPWLRAPTVQRVCSVLEADGYRALFVGGCVRNTLLGAPVADLDLSTDAPPETVSALMRKAGIKVVPTGIDHGTVTAVIDGKPFEITTFRRDIETDGRRAVVRFSTDVADDARRRDFTMNALYCDRHGGIIDPLGALPDLRARRLRFVGDAGARVREDYLRILRFFRFFAWYADPDQGMDEDALDACARHSGGLAQISAERIGAEMRKLLAAPDPGRAALVMQASGVLQAILPGAAATALPLLVDLEQAEGLAADPLLRLAALGGEDVAARLRLPRKEARRLAALSEAARDGMGAGEAGYRLGATDGAGAIVLRAALIGAPLPPDTAAQVTRGAQALFPVKARDVMETRSGPEIGAALEAMEARWVASGFRLTREDLLGGLR